MIQCKTLNILTLSVFFVGNSWAMDTEFDNNSKLNITAKLGLESNEIYALKNVASEKWLKGGNRNNQEISIADKESRPVIDGYLQWKLNIIDKNDKIYVLNNISSQCYLDGRGQSRKVVLITNRDPSAYKGKFLQWKIEELANGNFTLKGMVSNSYLDGRENLVKVTDESPMSNSGLQWKIEKLKDSIPNIDPNFDIDVKRIEASYFGFRVAPSPEIIEKHYIKKAKMSLCEEHPPFDKIDNYIYEAERKGPKNSPNTTKLKTIKAHYYKKRAKKLIKGTYTDENYIAAEIFFKNAMEYGWKKFSKLNEKLSSWKSKNESDKKNTPTSHQIGENIKEEFLKIESSETISFLKTPHNQYYQEKNELLKGTYKKEEYKKLINIDYEEKIFKNEESYKAARRDIKLWKANSLSNTAENLINWMEAPNLVKEVVGYRYLRSKNPTEELLNKIKEKEIGVYISNQNANNKLNYKIYCKVHRKKPIEVLKSNKNQNSLEKLVSLECYERIMNALKSEKEFTKEDEIELFKFTLSCGYTPLTMEITKYIDKIESLEELKNFNEDSDFIKRSNSLKLTLAKCHGDRAEKRVKRAWPWEGWFYYSNNLKEAKEEAETAKKLGDPNAKELLKRIEKKSFISHAIYVVKVVTPFGWLTKIYKFKPMQPIVDRVIGFAGTTLVTYVLPTFVSYYFASTPTNKNK